MFKKLQDIIFFWWDNFEGAKTFLTPLGVKKGVKNNVPQILKQRDIGNFMSFCNHGPSIMSRSFLNLIN
jgi:hypothetical protein